MGRDPATDLAIAWTAFDREARAAYREELAPDDATWLRARAWAAVLASALLEHSDDSPEHAAIGEHTVAQLASDT